MHSQINTPYKPSALDKSATIAFFGTIATWGFYYANSKYGLTTHVNISPTTYNWTVGGLPEFFGAWCATTFPAAIADELKQFALSINHHKAKIPHPLVAASVFGSIVTTVGIFDEMYGWSGGVSDEWDVARYATGFSVGLASALYHKQLHQKQTKRTTLEESL